jgi:hypothetical protein
MNRPATELKAAADMIVVEIQNLLVGRNTPILVALEPSSK